MLKSAQQALIKLPAVHRALRAIWSPPERVFRHLYFHGVFTVEVEPGISFRMQSYGNEVENDLFWRGYGNGWERSSLRIWKELAKKASYVADVGANTGVFALAAQAVSPKAKVVAVEPSARVFEKLRKNIALNNFSIMPVDRAASDEDGTATFYDVPSEHQYSASLDAQMLGAGTVETTVQVERLDAIFERAGFSRLDLMKMDVELHEPRALAGMMETLERSRPSMLIEVLNPQHAAEIGRTLDGLGYEFAVVREGLGIDENREPGAEAGNMLVCQPDILPGLRNIDA
jgi:FkbM family methyltransferase